jgi:hypothetical protein
MIVKFDFTTRNIGCSYSAMTLEIREFATNLELAQPDTVPRKKNKRRVGVAIVPVADVLARVHTIDLLDELDRRAANPEQQVLADQLQANGDYLGEHFALLVERRTALRSVKNLQPTTTQKKGKGPSPLREGSGTVSNGGAGFGSQSCAEDDDIPF